MSALHVIDSGLAPPVYGGSRIAQLVGIAGVVLALLVLAASVWLRLHTLVGSDGSVASTLAPATYGAAMLVPLVAPKSFLMPSPP